jgi:uncharacterized protein (DUF924 family)
MSRGGSAIDQILAFWFAPGTEKKWFVSDADFDAEVGERLLAHHERARAGDYDDWRTSARGCLALVILLDQVPRNVYRGAPAAFASDAAARAVTRHALERGFAGELAQRERMFLYLPFEHSEALADQQSCVALMADLDENPDWHDYACRHRDIIARFGRFPHRNAILGRSTGEEEERFLKEPKSSF